MKLNGGAEMAEIVVLEDDFTLLDLYKDVLERDGHKIYASTTVQAVQEFFAQNHADLCISDLRVGLLDGSRTIQALKRIVNRYHIPMILISAQMMVYEKECREAGFKHLLTKPFPNSVLVQVVAKVLEEAKTQTQSEEDKDDS
jgi:CheY-like chemotaxis protein